MVVASVTCRGQSHYQATDQHGSVPYWIQKDIRIIMENQIPAILIVQRLPWLGANIVTDDLYPITLRADQILQDRANDWYHARAQNDDRNILLDSPEEEVFKAGIEFDILNEQPDALVVGDCD